VFATHVPCERQHEYEKTVKGDFQELQNNKINQYQQNTISDILHNAINRALYSVNYRRIAAQQLRNSLGDFAAAHGTER
jgi:hypothetical protein